MTTLKAALRFPPSYPPPPPPPPEPQYPKLTSRFSADTLIIKSPPRPFQRIFTSTSSSTSPPASPLAATKRYHRRMSSTAKRQHAECDRRTSPPEVDKDGRSRPSLDEQRRPRRANSRSRSRTASSGSATAAEKLAGAAKEVIEKLALRRPSHARQRGGASEAGVESLAGARSRPMSISVSTPAPSRPDCPPFKLVDLPPSSDSRNAAAADTLAQSTVARATDSSVASSGSLASRPGRLPALAASRPRPKRIPPRLQLHQCPTSPPSPSIPPLRYNLPPPDRNDDCTTFRALLVKSPTLAAVTTRAANELLVRIDIGGQSTFTTTVETLLTAHDEGSVPSGKLGEFVESILDEVRRDLARDDEQPSPSQVSARHLVVPALLHSDDDSRISSMSRAPSFAPWPILRSPFPFADNCAPGEAAGGVVFHGAEDPTSPIDPLVSTAAAVLTAKNILSASRCAGGVRAPILSPALEPCDVERVCVVESHTAVAGRHKSIRPDLGHMFSVGPAASSPLPFVVSSTGARFDDCATFGFSDALQGGLGPFFDVVSGQAHESVALFSRPSWPVDSSPSPSSPVTGAMIPVPDVNVPLQHVVERKSLDYGFTDETLEDIVALSAGRELHGPSTASNSDARKPSLCANEPAGLKQAMVSEDLTAPRCPAPPVSLDDSTMHIFLDRTDAALSSATHNSDLDTSAPLQAGDSTYSCLLTFFRTARLPPSLVLPRETSTNGSPDVDPLYLSLFSLHPSTLFALATSLRTVAAEARWLGCPAVQAACEVERKRVQRVVDWLLGANRGGQNEKQVVGAEGQAARAGWI